jgi:tRNA threonylcarbamoyladenosine biosynthesis protein TsaE
MKKEFHKKDIEDISKEILNKIVKIKNSNATVVGLSGDLGAGKTTLTKALARELGIKKDIVSPTFVIMKIYELEKNSKHFSRFKKLIHIDAYRLNSHLELLNLGFLELVNDKDNLIIIEWPEIVEKCLDKDTCFIKLEHKDEDTRIIKMH